MLLVTPVLLCQVQMSAANKAYLLSCDNENANGYKNNFIVWTSRFACGIVAMCYGGIELY